MSRLLLVLALLAATLLGAGAQDPATPASLGERLFFDKTISKSGDVSCATCHDPKKSFTDGRKESVGDVGLEIGHNTPSLLGVRYIDEFVVDRGSQKGDLAERCLTPLANPLEMGSSIGDVVAQLSEDEGYSKQFDEAFGVGGVSARRVGLALAAYLDAQEPAQSPYRDFLDGSKDALSDREQAGLGIFLGRGQCGSCHAGPGLSDGEFHQALRVDSERVRSQRIRQHQVTRQLREHLSEKKDDNEVRQQARGVTSPYGRSSSRVLTPTLWDVARTGPYFRDGSESDLRKAVEIHVRELQEAAEVSGKRVSARRTDRRRRSLTPDSMTEKDVDMLVAFLRSLSPRG